MVAWEPPSNILYTHQIPSEDIFSPPHLPPFSSLPITTQTQIIGYSHTSPNLLPPKENNTYMGGGQSVQSPKKQYVGGDLIGR